MIDEKKRTGPTDEQTPTSDGGELDLEDLGVELEPSKPLGQPDDNASSNDPAIAKKR
jgi:hypothetical protein